MSRTSLSRVGLVVALASIAAASALPVAAAKLAPHRALYELSVADRGGSLIEARGAFAVEWRVQCEGITSQQHLWFVGRIEGGGEFDYDARFSTWESLDRRQMRFSMRSYQGGELVEEFRGQARMPADEAAGRATYTEPEGVEMTLPPETVFPTRHLEALIDRASAGERLARFEVFDGAGVGDDALSLVTAVIGDPVTITAAPAEGRAWPMALAYHSLADDAAETPLFELSFALTADGVMHDVLMDYGGFALRARLEEFTRLSRPDCS